MKLKKYCFMFLSFLFISVLVILSESTSVYALDEEYQPAHSAMKTKTFYIHKLGPNTTITINAINDHSCRWVHGYWPKDGTIDISFSAPDSMGFRSAKITMTKVDISNWTPYLFIDTSHSGYIPSGWTTGNYGSSGSYNELDPAAGPGTPIHNWVDGWTNGHCEFYIGNEYCYDSVTCNWTASTYTQQFNHYLKNPTTGTYELYKQSSEEIKSGTKVDPSLKYLKLDGYKSVKYTANPWNGSGWSQGTTNQPYIADWMYSVNLYYDPITYNVIYNGNGATGGQMTKDVVAYGQNYQLKGNAFKKQYTVTYDADGGQCPTATDVAAATFNGWNDQNDFVYRELQYFSGITAKNSF